MKKRWICLLLCALISMSLAGCGEKPPASSSGAASSSAGAVSSAGEGDISPDDEPEVPGGTNPLTGLPMEEAYENDRPVAVMLNNLKVAQPQLGVSQADIIYEVPAEGGITRMLAIYQSLDGVGNLGSIRSTRPYYLELALGHDAVLVHAGGSPEAYADIAAWNVDNMDGVNGGSDAKIFWRDAERRKTMGYEHSMLTDGASIAAYVQEHFRTEHEVSYQEALRFALGGSAAGGKTAEHISITFSYYKTGTFDYDADSGSYLVGQYGGAYTDGSTGEQVGVTNLLVLETSIYENAGDKEGRLTVKLTGEGAGTYFCGGKSVPIRWSKASRNDPFHYTAQDGAELELAQGPSYICIISPKQSTVTVS